MSSVGSINLDLNINNRGFDKQVDNIASRTKQKFGVMSVAVGNILADMATKAIASIGSFVKDSIDKGSELAELQNVVDTVFTTMSDKVDNFAQNALKAYGLTEAQAKRMMGTYGAMSKSFGYTEQQAYSMSEQLTALTADVASFYNLNHDEAYTKMKSVFTGETESLKELGVVMTQAALDQYALQNGYGRTTAQMSEQEKVALRLAFVQDKLSVASGDFVRTQDQWANQTRILTGQFESLKAAIGQGLINVLTPVIKVINVIMGKLVQLANAFKSFTAMIMGGSSGSGGQSAAGAMEGVADAAEQAASATGGISDAASGAAASAKKAQKSLMGFDEINKLQDTSSSDGGSGSGGGAGGGVSFDNIDFGSAIEQQESKMESSLSKLKELAEETFAVFKDGFNDGLGDDFDASLQRTKEHLLGIKSSLSNIFNDPDVQGAATNWARTVIHSLGQITGSVVSIAQSIAENLIGGVDLYLQQNSGFIKDRIIGMFNVSSEIWSICGDLASACASIFEVYRGPEAKACTANIIGIFSNAALGSTQLALQLGRDILDCIATPIIQNEGKIAEAIRNTLGPVSGVLETLNNAVKNTFEKIFQVYNEYVKPMFDKFKDGLSSIVSTLLDAYNNNIAPVLGSLSSKFSEVFESNIQPMINSFLELVGKIAQVIGDVWQNAIVPVVNWLIATLVPILAPIFEQLGNVVLALMATFSSVMSGIMQALGGVIDFIAGLFTGDWDRCWQGIKDIFEGIWNAISGYFLGIWEVIKGIVSAALEVIKGTIQWAFELISGIIQAAWDIIKNIFSVVLEAIKSLVSTVFDAISTAISTALDTISTIVTTVWNAIKASISTALNAISTVVTTVWNAIETAISTTLDTISTVISTVWNAIKTTVSTILNSIKTVVTNLWNGIKASVSNIMDNIKTAISNAWNSIKSSISTIISNIKTAVTNGWNNIKTSVSTVVGNIKSSVSSGFTSMKTSISNVMDGIKTKITNVFNSIWSFIKSIVNSILGGVESMANGLISAINGMVKALNKLNIDIPDWVPSVGGKKLGFNIPEVSKISIPRLAQGGYVSANQPQLAMIGDNKTQGEIVSPEGKMMEIMLKALEAFFGRLRDAGYSNQQQQGDFGDLVIPIYLDGTILDEVIVTAQQRRNVRSGGR
mgnify:CR=1 FL=1